jgi:O-antigen/teichoic acid export membrane protein
MTRPGDDDEQAPLDKETVVKRAVSSSATVTLRGIAVRAIGLATNLVLARLLAPAEFGLAALGFTIVSFATFLADGGLGAGLIRRKNLPTRRELESVLGFSLAMTLIVVLASAVFVPIYGRSALLVLVMVTSLCAVSFEAPGAILLERHLQFGRRVVVEVTESLVYSVVAIGSVVLGAGVWGLAIAIVARGVAGATAMNTVAPMRVLRPRLDFSALRGILGFGVKFQAVSAVNLIRDQGINLGLAAIGGVGALGLWSLANRILQIPYVVFESLWRVSFPAMSRLEEVEYNSALALRRIMNIVGLVGGFVIVCLASTSPDLLQVVFGARWQPASVLIFPTCMGLLVNGPVSVAAAGYLYARGQTNSILVATIAHTAAWVGIALGLYDWLGLVSVALGALAGGLVDSVILGRALRRTSGVKVEQVLALPIVIGVISAGIGYLVCAQLSRGLPGLLVSVVVGGSVFLAAMAALSRGVLKDLVVLVRQLGAGASPT